MNKYSAVAIKMKGAAEIQLEHRLTYIRLNLVKIQHLR